MDHLKAALELSPAVQHLQEGCTRLGLNENMAVELVAFLHLKRRFMPGDDEPNSLMCSSRLNQLWQWMLLNTKVRPQSLCPSVPGLGEVHRDAKATFDACCRWRGRCTA
jgi:hypothetical protein